MSDATRAAGRLKRGGGSDDPHPVRDVSCPICNADVPMDGDERPGDTVYCAYCKAPLKVGKHGQDDDLDLEEDF